MQMKQGGGGRTPPELLVIEAEEFPTAVIVELWHRDTKGKREFLDSRRYEAVPDAPAQDHDDASMESGGGDSPAGSSTAPTPR